MKRENIEAIVLKNINYKDSHRIYTLLSKDRGKISAIARGVRKISSKRSGSLDTLNHVIISATVDKSGFYSINEVKVVDSFRGLKDTLEFILTGMYFCELVDVFLESDHETHEIFRLLKSALNVLAKKPARAEIVVNVFEFRLLERLGLGLSSEDEQLELVEVLNSLKYEKDLTKIMDYAPRMTRKADILIKDHLKRMVETYARFPRLNRFLMEELS